MHTRDGAAPRRTGRRWVAVGFAALACSGALTACGSGSGGSGDQVGVSLILKTLSNPYFVSMEKDAKTEAAKDNVSLTVAAGQSDGDTQSQIAAIDNAISRGDKGILITINGNAVNTELQKARNAGIYVIALDTAPTPASVVDVTYATDNEQAGKLIGQYAAAKLNGGKAVIAMLDLFNNQVVSVDTSRDHGFLEGIGIAPGSTTENGQEAKSGHYTGGAGGDYTVACHQPTQGAIPGGKTAMENCLSANGDINVVYTINEPAADGALQALQAAGKKNVLVVTIDGSCKYLNGLVTQGAIAADAVQYPGKMASQGVQAISKLAQGGGKPSLPAGQAFINTGTALATANPLSGVTSQTPAQAASACWGS
ncbi:MAG TPA: substrate-binding domain-containing protein [Kutzneria sp.]|jgi:fructose transport system substrate-binding protein|nr:substrate-binding domain-containing protein [Kutzneria sp.]